MNTKPAEIEALLDALASDTQVLAHSAPRARIDETDREELIEICGFENEALLQQLIGAGITAQSFAALRFIPLVLVAWSDGGIDEEERETVLQATVDVTGIGWGTRAYRLLESWLESGPDPRAVSLWRDYAKALTDSLDQPARETLRNRILGDAYRVAEASGGVFGIGRINGAEERALAALETVL
ncbi:MAG: hypothetical protein AAF493_22485 [Pseudomonadota bacterium]